MGSLIERREAVVGEPLPNLKMKVVPFKTYHGTSAPGSVGLVVNDADGSGTVSVIYTSDFSRVEAQPLLPKKPDMVIIQAHWLNEPRYNRPNHMSFQTAMAHIRRWDATQGTYLVDMSDGDLYPDDPANNALKKIPPLAPLTRPGSDIPYDIPRCQEEWQSVVEEICRDTGIKGKLIVAHDGLRVTVSSI